MKFLDVYKRLVLEADANKRIEFLKDKYQHKIINFLLQIDNDKYHEYTDEQARQLQLQNDADIVVSAVVNRLDPAHGIYSEWILRNILLLSKNEYDRLFEEDFYKVFDDLADYHRYKYLFKKLAQKENNPNILKLADINQIKGFVGLYDAVRLIDSDIDEADAKEEEKRLEKDVEKVYVSDNYIILIPKTKEASCTYGRNTRWCTAATNAYNAFYGYNDRGPLYIVIDKKNDEKFQFHFQSNQYMDSTDSPLNLKNFFSEHSEIAKPLLLESLKQNINSFIQFIPTEKLLNIAEEDEKYVINFIQNDILFAIEYSNKNEKIVNENQKIYQFDGQNVIIDISEDVKEIYDLVDYVIEDESQDYCKEILENGFQNYDYSYNASDHTSINDIVDALNDKNKDILEKYLNKHNMKLSDLWEDERPKGVIDFLKGCYDLGDETATSDAYYNKIKDAITDAIGEYKWKKDGGMVLDWGKKQLKNIVESSLEYESENDFGISMEYTQSFIKPYHSLLKNSDDLKKPNFNHVYATTEMIEKYFNERFYEEFDENVLKTESFKKLDILKLCLENLTNI